MKTKSLLLTFLLFLSMLSTAWADEIITIVADGQTISDVTTWENCTVNITGDGTVTFGSRIYINGDVALNLGAGATLIANGGIGVHEGNSLTIDGEGNLTANSNTFSEAAIGGSYGSPNAGTIIISGGTINASNNSKGVSAAIGGGYSNYGGNGTIIINGGTITTNIIQGGAASIGGSKGANGGHITIAGGSITANRSGAVTGAGIGGGEKGNAGIIIISGGTVTVPASNSAKGAGIGSGEKSDGEGSITINDGNITAVGGAVGGSAGIGGGLNSSAGTITITGGVVNATGGYESAGIGGARGVNGSGGTIAISGGQVTARGSDGAYGIGPSKDGAEGTISMSWTDNTDFIDASYAGTITILKGKRFFYDETEMFAKAEGLYKQEKKIIPAVLDNSLLSSGEILMQRNFVTTEGTAVDVSYEVYDYNGDKLTDGTDYTAVIKNSNDQIVTTVDQLGDYTLTVTGMGNYSGSNAYTFSLVEWDMALMQDGSEHYVNLPENGTKTVYLNVGQSIKVYDSEGKDGKLVVSDGRLLLHVPTGYALVVSGKTDAMKWNEAQHDTTNFLSAYENENLTDEITSLFGNSNNISFASAGNSMLIRLNAQKIYRYDDQYGLELTISVQKSLSHSDITIATIPDQTYSGSEICPAVVVNDGKTMLALGTDYTVECADNVSAGTATVTITGKGNYTGSATKTFEISKAPLTVTALNDTIVYGDEPSNAGVKFDGFVNEENEKSLNGTLVYSNEYKQYGNVGDYVITPSGLTADNYKITFVDGKLTVEPKYVAVTWDKQNTFTYDGFEQAPTATAEGLVNGDECTITVSGAKDVGSHTATATKLSNTNYKLPATGLEQNFEITKAPLTITARNKTIAYGDEPANDGVEYSGFVGEEGVSVLGGVLTYGYNYKKGNKTGEYTITPGGLTADNYEINFVSGTLIVETKKTTFAAIQVFEDENGKRAEINGEYKGEGAVNIPEDIENVSVEFNRTFTVDKYSTIVLPFEIAAGSVEGAVFYKIDDIDVKIVGNDTIWGPVHITEVTDNIEANMPYLLQPTATKLTFKDPVTLNTSEKHPYGFTKAGVQWEFRGTYHYFDFANDSTHLIGKSYGFVAKDQADGLKVGQFRWTSSKSYILPMRGYLVYRPVENGDENGGDSQKNAPMPQYESRSLSAPSVSSIPEALDVEIVDKDGSTTVIGKINTRTGEIRLNSRSVDRWFDLQGRVLNGKPSVKGRYLHNGKIEIVK